MDENFETSADSANESQDSNLGKQIAKDFVQSTAISAGVLAGFMVVGYSISKIQDFRAARKAKKNPATENSEEN
jgi:hypothetical protein